MSRRGWLLFGTMCLVWGIPYLLIKIADGGVSPPVLVLARTGIGALVLLPLAVRPGAWKLIRRHWLPLLGFAVCEIIGPWWLLSDAELRLPSSLTGLLIAAVPIIAVLFTRALGSAERMGPARWTGLGIGLVGVVLLAAPHLGGGNGFAVGEVLLVTVGYALGPVLAARRLAGLPNLLVAATCLGFAALVYVPAAAFTWPRTFPGWSVLGALLGLGLVCTALAFGVFFALIHEVGPARALVFTYVNPAVAVLAGVLLLGEPLTAAVLVSFTLILAGCVLATGSIRRRRRREPAPVHSAQMPRT